MTNGHQLPRYSLLILVCWLGFIPIAHAQLEKIENYYHRQQKEAKHGLQSIQFIQQDMELVENYSGLSQIILLRHGEPALDQKGWRSRKQAIKFIQDYDSVEVYPPECASVMLQDQELRIIYTSNINRSISTANQLFGQSEIQHADSLFREFERKIFSFPNIKLPISWWLNISRVLWFMGLNKKGIESFSEAKSRAMIAVQSLEKDASANGKTLLVSHGLLNHFLVKYLRKNGWTEVFDGGKGYLSQKMLVKYVP